MTICGFTSRAAGDISAASTTFDARSFVVAQKKIERTKELQRKRRRRQERLRQRAREARSAA
jgi:hypothetical protein